MEKIRAKEDMWLYTDFADGREFAVEVCAPDGTDLTTWQECTNAEKEQWERAHNDPNNK